MLLEFGVKNFKSIKDEAVFSLIANDNESKLANVFTHKLATGEEIRLLKSAAIFGANASGKSNVLDAIRVFYELIIANNIKAGDDISYYDSFKFNSNTKNQPTSFWMSFIGPKNYKYEYTFSFDKKNFSEEKLAYRINGMSEDSVIILQRLSKNGNIHTGKLGNNFGNIEYKIFYNQLFLSKFGKDEPHDFLTPIFTYFNNIDVLNTLNQRVFRPVEVHLLQKVKDNPVFKRKLECLLQIADTGLSGITIQSFPTSLSDQFGNQHKGKLEDGFGIIHKVFDGDNEIGTDILDIYRESAGSIQTILFGGMILDCLERGGILFLDELDSSLHPMLVKTLLEIIQSKKLNPKNAQVVFTTHDINVLNQNLFRKDQYWFTEKNKFGETELFSLQDFDGVSEDTPFSSWYMAGKFGAIPNIQSIEKILDGEKETD